MNLYIKLLYKSDKVGTGNLCNGLYQISLCDDASFHNALN